MWALSSGQKLERELGDNLNRKLGCMNTARLVASMGDMRHDDLIYKAQWPAGNGGSSAVLDIIDDNARLKKSWGA